MDIYVDKSQYDEAMVLFEEFMNSEAEFYGEFSDDMFEEE